VTPKVVQSSPSRTRYCAMLRNEITAHECTAQLSSYFNIDSSEDESLASCPPSEFHFLILIIPVCSAVPCPCKSGHCLGSLAIENFTSLFPLQSKYRDKPSIVAESRFNVLQNERFGTLPFSLPQRRCSLDEQHPRTRNNEPSHVLYLDDKRGCHL
jgi:hypothetical protein